MRQKLIIISCISICCALVFFVLYFFADNPNNSISDFTRIIKPHVVQEQKMIDLEYNSWYIAGITDTHLYLGNSTDINKILDLNMKKMDSCYLGIRNPDSLTLRSGQLTVDSPYFYLSDRLTHQVVRGKLYNQVLQKYVQDSAFFAEAVPISQNAIVFKSLDPSGRQFVFKKKVYNSGTSISILPFTGKAVDSIFSMDGKFNYDHATRRLTYLYYYRNQYLYLDSNLNLLNKGHTIDSSAHAPIKIATIFSGTSKILAGPPPMINVKSTVWSNFLFINTSGRAKNENRSLFDQSSVIDVYDLLGNNYQFSFYIWKQKNAVLRDFCIRKHVMIALYDHFLYIYKLDTAYFP